MKKIFSVIVILLFVFLTTMPAFAASGPDYWLGNSGVDVSIAGNWTGASANQPPQPGDSLVFDAAGSSGTSLIDDVSSASFTGITFNSDADAFTVGNGGNSAISMTLTGALADNSGNDETLGMDIGGTVINNGTGAGGIILSGGLDSSVSAIMENSATSSLTILSNPITVNSGGTTLTDTLGTLAVNSGVIGSGNLILNNNTGTNGALSLGGVSVNNTGTITNSGTGAGDVEIASVGSNVTDIIEDSSTSPLDVVDLAVNSGGTTLTNTSGELAVSSDVTGTGNLTLVNEDATPIFNAFDNNSGTITISGAGTGGAIIDGGIGPNVTGITENSASSGLLIDSDALTVNSSGTTLTDTAGTFTVSGGVAGTGNLILNNNTAVDSELSLITNSVNNTGTITNSGTGTGSTLISALIGSNVTNVIQNSSNSALILSNGSNAYMGSTTIDAGTLQIQAADAIPSTSDVSIAGGATLDLDGHIDGVGSLAGAGTVTTSAAGSILFGTLDDNSTTFSGTIQDGSSGQIEFIKEGNGTLSLSGANTYSGGTIITSGAVRAENPNAFGTGFVTNEATLSLGTTSLSIGGVYTQSPGSILRLTINSPSVFGNITSGVAAVVDAGSAINVTVGGNIPNNTAFDIINTGGAGVGSAPLTVTSSSSRTSFTDSIVGDNLILTANTLASYASLANNPNALAIGTVLDNMTNPSSDMTNVLNTLSSLTDAQITAALNTMGPIVDEGVKENSTAALNNLVGATLDRIQSSLDHASGNPVGTGVSSGDESGLNGIWAKPYGSYLTQGTRQGIQGYDAWNAGTAIGVDHLFDNLTLGVSAGYAYGQVNSDVNSATADMNSAQGTLYAGYQGTDLPYFIDLAGSYAWNWYDGQRDITVGNFNRTADSNYDGQQYGAYLGGGYKFNIGDNLELTPLTSIQWTHLSIDGYTESNANSLDLMVNRQSYDTLESGVGASIAYPVKYDWGNIIPEFHAKWLYDFIDDDMTVTSAFTGGGASFTNVGASPAKDAVNIGGKLTFDLKDDLSLIAGVDTELKDQFFGVSGSASVRYKF